MKAIGPSFALELAAAGLAGLPFSWGSDGKITFGPPMSQEQKTAVLAVYDAHDPETSAPPLPLAPLVIARRLTPAEQATVISMQSGTAEQQGWYLQYFSAREIDPNDPATVAGFEAVFGAERAAALLAPEA